MSTQEQQSQHDQHTSVEGLHEAYHELKREMEVQAATQSGAQATQAATQAGEMSTQAAAQAGQMSTQAAAAAGTWSTMIAGFAGFVIGIFMALAFVAAAKD